MAYGTLFSKVYEKRQSQFSKGMAPIIQQFYEETSIGQDEKIILDIACGNGHLALHFLQHGYEVLGLDYSSEMLQLAEQKTHDYMEKGMVTFFCENAENFQIQKKVGLVVWGTASISEKNHAKSMQDFIQLFG
ncbi:class I SAM-dependent methyltransferase [Bacillus cereus]|uniref:class I SAM-dependent methyltransferase n=1 Tax=Bacillus cereus TaxID=1396 RepID=UPI000BF50DE2|nr:class I SAM-dependent methyltransferase [Bacillus cereus]PEX86944.1 hypothetical protein CN450_15410 [Bacillus cereus]